MRGSTVKPSLDDARAVRMELPVIVMLPSALRFRLADLLEYKQGYGCETVNSYYPKLVVDYDVQTTGDLHCSLVGGYASPAADVPSSPRTFICLVMKHEAVKIDCRCFIRWVEEQRAAWF